MYHKSSTRLPSLHLFPPGVHVVLHHLQCVGRQGEGPLPGQPAAALHLHPARADRHPAVCPGVRRTSEQPHGRQRNERTGVAPTCAKRAQIETRVAPPEMNQLPVPNWAVKETVNLCVIWVNSFSVYLWRCKVADDWLSHHGGGNKKHLQTLFYVAVKTSIMAKCQMWLHFTFSSDKGQKIPRGRSEKKDFENVLFRIIMIVLLLLVAFFFYNRHTWLF